MKKNFTRSVFGSLILLSTLVVLFGSCTSNLAAITPTTDLKPVKDSVSYLMENIAADISQNGSGAWLNYFEDDPRFFMANDGVLAFKDYQLAKTFINNTLVKSISKITLSWSNVNVDPLTADYAAIGSEYHEDITMSTGKKRYFDGYFTATAQYVKQKWQLRNVHWSTNLSKKK